MSKKRFIRLTLGMISLGLSAFSICLPSNALAINSQSIVALTNTQRASAGLPSLVWNGSLASSANSKAADICQKGYWAHTAPDGTTAWQLMSRAGYPYVTGGENLAKGFSSDSGVISGWMASPGHRANILNAKFQDVGIAYAQCSMNGQSTTVVVAHYGATRHVQESSRPTTKPRPAAKPVTARTIVVQKSAKPAVKSATTNKPNTAVETFGTRIWKLTRQQQKLLFNVESS